MIASKRFRTGIIRIRLAYVGWQETHCQRIQRKQVGVEKRVSFSLRQPLAEFVQEPLVQALCGDAMSQRSALLKRKVPWRNGLH